MRILLMNYQICVGVGARYEFSLRELMQKRKATTNEAVFRWYSNKCGESFQRYDYFKGRVVLCVM